jgi:TatD DNase family protein
VKLVKTLFDSHVHFNGAETPEYSVREQLERARASGVEQLIAVGGSCDLNNAACKAAEEYASHIRAAIGFDRSQKAEMASSAAIQDSRDRIARVCASAGELGFVMAAIGEIGLDYHYEPETRDSQLALFDAQCALAVDLDLPVIVHSRDADEDTLAVLRKYIDSGGKGLKGVLHCFTGNQGFADALCELGLYLSFSGILTFRNADALRKVASSLPASSLLVETDSPYLAPVPHRGKRNEPAYVREVAQVLADVRGDSFDSIASITTQNAQKLFRFPVVA